MSETYRDSNTIRTVAVIGAGVIGGGWAAAFLGAGKNVQLHDPDPNAGERTRAHIQHAWPQMVALGHARADDDWQSRLSFYAGVEAAVDGADFVQENTPERLDLKQALFARLDPIVSGDMLIASSTSSYAISELVAGCERATRYVLGHPFNPVHLMPLVEVGGGPRTDAIAIDTALDFYRALGKVPIRLHQEIFGHIANRLTSAMFREAVSLVANGVASVEDIDNAVRFGPALKWAIQGQFTTFHTSGGAGGLAAFLPKFAPGIIRRWQSMSDPDLADTAVQAKLVEQMQAAAAGRTVGAIVENQDHYLMELLRLFADTGTAPPKI